MARSSNPATLTVAVALFILSSCLGSIGTYSHYETIDSRGWQHDDTLTFTAGPVVGDGLFGEELGLRTTSLYPFTQLTVIVSQEAHPSGYSRTDTLCVSLTDDEGIVLGEGISHYQYSFSMKPAMLADGDTLVVSVRHDMRRTPLEGITDVGFTLLPPH